MRDDPEDQRLARAVTGWNKILTGRTYTAPSGSMRKECQMNTQNLATNVYCWGDEMKEKSENTLRILDQLRGGARLVRIS